MPGSNRQASRRDQPLQLSRFKSLLRIERVATRFFEVRTRRGDALGSPEESLTPRKRARLLTVAQEFLQAHEEYADRAWRVDLVAIELDRTGRVARMAVIKGAVEG
jgi:Holliday junction resolvase-like predicted endonuclease